MPQTLLNNKRFWLPRTKAHRPFRRADKIIRHERKGRTSTASLMIGLAKQPLARMVAADHLSTTQAIDMKNTPCDLLLSATFKGPSTIKVVFFDKSFALPIARLEMPLDRIRWDTARVLPDNTGMTVEALKDEIITIDASTIRYLVDKEYAAQIEADLDKIRLTDDELKELARDNPPPQRWLDNPEDLRLESWK